MAEDLLLARTQLVLRERVREFAELPLGDDPDERDVAALESLAAILLASGDGDRQKALALRKATLAAHPTVQLQPDGLRKREDKILQTLADFIEEKLNNDGPFDRPLDMLFYLERRLPTAIHDLRRIVTRVNGFQFVELTDEDVLTTIERIAALVLTANLMISSVPELKVVPRPSELWAVHICYTMLGRPMTFIYDQMSICKLLDRHEALGNFREALVEYDDTVVRRWRTALQNCHDNCTYGRATEISTYCPPHHLLACLELLLEGTTAVQERRFAKFVNFKYGRLSDYWDVDED